MTHCSTTIVIHHMMMK